MYKTLFSATTASLPTKSVLSPKQEHDIMLLLLDIVVAKGSLPKKEDTILFYFDKTVISSMVYQLRYESPYGVSSRCCILESLARHDLSLEKLVVRDVGQYLLQYVTDERGLMIQNDGKRICRL